MTTANEPVAWLELYKDMPNNLYWEWDDCKVKGYWRAVPLYTHPSEHDLGVAEAIGFDKGYKAATQSNTQLHPAKTLTDEVQEVLVDVIRLLESQRIWNGMGWHYNLIPPFSYLPVAEKVKAILRKAQEK
jgi:hypothetical protein